MVPPVGDLVTACRERGLLALTAGDNTLRLAPALIVTEKEIAEGCAIIDKALGSVKQ
jgi:acetylornithine/N-succinyldiaminopimelate aminotransferase